MASLAPKQPHIAAFSKSQSRTYEINWKLAYFSWSLKNFVRQATRKAFPLTSIYLFKKCWCNIISTVSKPLIMVLVEQFSSAVNIKFDVFHIYGFFYYVPIFYLTFYGFIFLWAGPTPGSSRPTTRKHLTRHNYHTYTLI